MKKSGGPSHDLLQRKLEIAIDMEMKRQSQGLKHVQGVLRHLRDRDRDLHAQGGADLGVAIERIDAEMDAIRHKINDEERRMIAGERRYSKIRSEREGIGGFLVGLTKAELENLERLSHSYHAFGSHLSKGPEADAADQAEAVSAKKGCWGCTAACGGCTGCGQACSQLNACIGRHE